VFKFIYVVGNSAFRDRSLTAEEDDHLYQSVGSWLRCCSLYVDFMASNGIMVMNDECANFKGPSPLFA
jgi:hypothetical protein